MFIVDLCCGIGRFTGDTVVSIDFDPKTMPTIIADICHLPLRGGIAPDLVHASPPCTYFSIARRPQYGLDLDAIGQSLELVATCFKAFEYLGAKNWTLENPLGFLSRLLNETRLTYEVHDYPKKKTTFYSNMRGLRRAVIPDHVRKGITKLAEPKG